MSSKCWPYSISCEAINRRRGVMRVIEAIDRETLLLLRRQLNTAADRGVWLASGRNHFHCFWRRTFRLRTVTRRVALVTSSDGEIDTSSIMPPRWSYTVFFHHPRMRSGDIFSRVRLCVCPNCPGRNFWVPWLADCILVGRCIFRICVSRLSSL